MRKIFKPKNVINDQSTVQIPDVIFKNESEEEEKEVLTEEVLERVRQEIREEMAAEIEKKKLTAAHEHDSIIAKAKKDAKKILDDAAESRKSILNEANTSAAMLKKEAYDEGLMKGITEKSEVLERLAGLISEDVEKLQVYENEYFEEYEKQLKYLASEIAEKIIYQKIQEDDMVMYNLVKNAIKSVREASWISAEVSQKMSGYIDSLEQELSDNGIKAEIIIKDGAPDDTCVLNTSDGVVVATVSMQLANLKEFIDRQDKGGNDD